MFLGASGLASGYPDGRCPGQLFLSPVPVIVDRVVIRNHIFLTTEKANVLAFFLLVIDCYMHATNGSSNMIIQYCVSNNNIWSITGRSYIHVWIFVYRDEQLIYIRTPF